MRKLRLQFSLVMISAIASIVGADLQAAAQTAADQLYDMEKFEQDVYAPEGADTPQVAGQKKVRACIGEKRCPVAVQSMFPCGYTEKRAGRELCTIHTGDGNTKVLDHMIDHQGTHGGHQCGYSWFLVTCLLP
ncbi:hypothetical protein CO661_11860 [Sinorhizobium fredii]|uniref:Uncharacterized protein n=1 Tax=Rhizobium fredii TaxID=380 RepID=A0A2A6LXR7_RHIFR|nr:hypothetical protein [Sinorhizobium fredii]PDT47433.1 hypothetical protein CO661_11860 [Sinorhizobium fredii]